MGNNIQDDGENVKDVRLRMMIFSMILIIGMVIMLKM